MRKPGQIILITGPIGSGKTTYCAQRVAVARAGGWDVAGVLSAAHFDGAIKIGIDVVDLRSGERRHLARLRAPASDPRATDIGIATQRWVFDTVVLNWGNQVLATSTPCDLLVVDELGPLEWEQGQGWMTGLVAVDTRAFVTALVVVRPSLVELALARWPDAAWFSVGNQ